MAYVMIKPVGLNEQLVVLQWKKLYVIYHTKRT